MLVRLNPVGADYLDVKLAHGWPTGLFAGEATPNEIAAWLRMSIAASAWLIAPGITSAASRYADPRTSIQSKVWERILGWLSTASLIDWLVRVAIFLFLGGGIGTAVTALGSVPVAARIAFGLGLFLLAIATILVLAEFWHPRLEMSPRVNLEIEEDKTYSSRASVMVQNSRDGGGMRGTAKAVAPHVEIFTPEGDLVTDEVGWEDGEQRDLRPTRKEHQIYIAFKQEADPWLCATLPGPDDRYMLGFGREFLVRVTLRGDFPRKFVREFRMSTAGKGGGIDFQ